MRSWIRGLWDAVVFRTEAYQRLSDRRDAFMQGFLVIVVVALLAGLPGFVTQFVKGLRPAGAEISDARAGFREAMQRMAPYLVGMGVPSGMQDQVLQQIEQNMESGFNIAAEIQNLPTVLPKPIGRTLEAMGAWLSVPFSSASFPLGTAVLATWLGYGIWVMLAAKLMGGRGTLAGFFGATALFAVPHVLDFFRWVPYVGSWLGVIAFLWGVAIYMKATAVSHKFQGVLGVVAVLLPLVVVAFLSILLIFGVGTLAVLLSTSGR
jgi:hypothetical protein